MATYFADSSGLVKRHVSEIGSVWFSQIADAQSGNTIIISRLSISEVFSAFNRRLRELSLNQTAQVGQYQFKLVNLGDRSGPNYTAKTAVLTVENHPNIKTEKRSGKNVD